MIFPKTNIAELERALEEKRRIFHESRQKFMANLTDVATTKQVLSHNWMPIVTFLITALPLSTITFKFISKLASKKKSKLVWTLFKYGWLWKVLKWVGQTSLRNGAPASAKLAKSVTQRIFNSLFH